MMANTMSRGPAAHPFPARPFVAPVLARPVPARPVTARPVPARPVADELTVCVPGSVLAPAPAAEAPPVFVDDSGTRRRLIRVTGCVLMLLLVGFLGVVGLALALPSVGSTVALGNVAPFLVPAAAAKPPAPAPVAFVSEPVQNVAHATKRPAPKPKAKLVSKKETPVVVEAPVKKPVTGPVTAPPATDTTPTTGTTKTGTGTTGTTKTGATGTGTTGTTKTGTTGTTGTTTTGTTTGPATDPAAPAAPNG